MHTDYNICWYSMECSNLKVVLLKLQWRYEKNMNDGAQRHPYNQISSKYASIVKLTPRCVACTVSHLTMYTTVCMWIFWNKNQMCLNKSHDSVKDLINIHFLFTQISVNSVENHYFEENKQICFLCQRLCSPECMFGLKSLQMYKYHEDDVDIWINCNKHQIHELRIGLFWWQQTNIFKIKLK